MTQVAYRTLNDKVAVLPEPTVTITQAGIIIPDQAKERPKRGTVTAAGPGKPDEPMTVKIGDEVLYGCYSGTEIAMDGDIKDSQLEVGGNNPLIMREQDILAVIKDGVPNPIANRVLVEIDEAKDQSDGGIFIPNSAQVRPLRGKVLLVGPGQPNEPMQIGVGDTVLYGKYVGTETEVNGKVMLLVRQTEVFCVFDADLKVEVINER